MPAHIKLSMPRLRAIRTALREYIQEHPVADLGAHHAALAWAEYQIGKRRQRQRAVAMKHADDLAKLLRS